jgi:quinol monooxygenase YgiN
MDTTSGADTFVISARYHVRDGELAEVLTALRAAAVLTRAEPGCLEFRVHVATDEENRVLLYEEYHSAADFDAHCATAHFAELILGRVVPRLESRERVAYRRLV